MASNIDLPTAGERFAACFRVRHRLLQVIGVPLALGGVVAVFASGPLHGRGVALGAIIALIGVLFAGWYVVSGLDKKLVDQLVTEKRGTRGKGALQSVLAAASPETRALLDRIRAKLDALEPAVERATIQGGNVAMIDGLHEDIVSLRHKTVDIATALPRLQIPTVTADATRLDAEVARLTGELAEVSGALHEALAASKSSVEAELARCRATIQLDKDLANLLATIEGDANAVEKATAAPPVPYADVERLRERLATTITTADRLLAAAKR